MTTFWRGGRQITENEAQQIAAEFPPGAFCLRVEGGGGVCLDMVCPWFPHQWWLTGWTWSSLWRCPATGETHEVVVQTSRTGQRGRVRAWRCPPGADPWLHRQTVVDQRFVGFPPDRLFPAEIMPPRGWRKAVG